VSVCCNVVDDEAEIGARQNCYFEIARQHFFFFRFLATSLSSPPSITTALKMYLRTQEGV